MRSVLGILARLVCWAVGGLAAFVAIVCVVNLVDPDEPDSRIGAAVMLVAALAVIAGCAWALRRTPRLLTPTADRSSDEVVEADRRRRAGEAVVLRPGRRRTITLMLVSLAFAGTAVWGFVTSPNVVLALAAVLMGAAAGLFALRMVPGRMYLRIDPDGVLVHGPFRTRRWRWNDIGHFEVSETPLPYGGRQKFGGFTRRDADPRREGAWTRMNRSMSGVDVTLPDSYGLRHADLAASSTGLMTVTRQSSGPARPSACSRSRRRTCARTGSRSSRARSRSSASRCS